MLSVMNVSSYQYSSVSMSLPGTTSQTFNVEQWCVPWKPVRGIIRVPEKHRLLKISASSQSAITRVALSHSTVQIFDVEEYHDLPI